MLWPTPLEIAPHSRCKTNSKFAEYKLLGGRAIARLSSEQHIWARQVCSLISARCCLDTVMNSKDAVDLANEVVKSHLRLVVEWDEDHRVIGIVSPT